MSKLEPPAATIAAERRVRGFRFEQGALEAGRDNCVDLRVDGFDARDVKAHDFEHGDFPRANESCESRSGHEQWIGCDIRRRNERACIAGGDRCQSRGGDRYAERTSSRAAKKVAPARRSRRPFVQTRHVQVLSFSIVKMKTFRRVAEVSLPELCGVSWSLRSRSQAGSESARR